MRQAGTAWRDRMKNTRYPEEFEQGYVGFVRPRNRPPKKLRTAKRITASNGAAATDSAAPASTDQGILGTTPVRVADDLALELQHGAGLLALKSDGASAPADQGILDATPVRVADDDGFVELQGWGSLLNLKSDGTFLPADQGILGTTRVRVADDVVFNARQGRGGEAV